MSSPAELAALAAAALSPTSSSSPSPLPSDPAALVALITELRAKNDKMNVAGMALQERLAAEQAKNAAASARVQGGPGLAKFVKPPPAPEFTGLNTKSFELEAWVRDMEDQFTAFDPSVFPDDRARISYAARYLKGAAREWWRDEDKSGSIDADWQAFVAHLTDRWQPRQAAEVARERLDQLRQTGSVSAFSDVFKRMLVPIKDMSAADQIHRYVASLSNVNVQNRVREKEPKTLHEAINAAVHAEAYMGRGTGAALQKFGRAAAASTSVPMDVNHIRDQQNAEEESPVEPVEAMFAMMQTMQQQILALSTRQPPRPANKDRIPDLKPGDIRKMQEKGICFRCKQTGHMKNECTNPFKKDF
jgi:hypothetical protein